MISIMTDTVEKAIIPCGIIRVKVEYVRAGVIESRWGVTSKTFNIRHEKNIFTGERDEF